MYAHPLAFRDLKNEHRDHAGAARGRRWRWRTTACSRAAICCWDGVIVKEAHDIYDTSTSPARARRQRHGGAGVPVRRAGGRRRLCQALEFEAEQTFDYGDKHGVAIESIYGIEKMQFGSGAADPTT